jgi:hypothetical protein
MQCSVFYGWSTGFCVFASTAEQSFALGTFPCQHLASVPHPYCVCWNGPIPVCRYCQSVCTYCRPPSTVTAHTSDSTSPHYLLNASYTTLSRLLIAFHIIACIFIGFLVFFSKANVHMYSTSIATQDCNISSCRFLVIPADLLYMLQAEVFWIFTSCILDHATICCLQSKFCPSFLSYSAST